MDYGPISRRHAMQLAAVAAVAATPLRELFADGSTPASQAQPSLSGSAIAQAEPYVHPGMNWSAVELGEFLNALPPQDLRGLKKALALEGSIPETLTPAEQAKEVDAIEKQLLWISTSIVTYPFHDQKKIEYHELVKWVAEDAGVDEWIRNTQPTFVIERALLERIFANVWDKLTPQQREELLAKLDTKGTIEDKAAIAALSGSAALAALSTTVYFAGFAFYTTMSFTISLVAGWFGVTLPFAAYTGASSIVAFLSGPVGWAILAVAAVVGVAIAGRANVQKTTAAICQIHLLKVAALMAAGKRAEDSFQTIGNPLKRQLVGKWSWRTARRTIEFTLRGDDTFTCKDFPDQRPELYEGAGFIKEGKGTWSAKDGSLTIAMTHVWALAFWKECEITWIDDKEIVKVTETEVDLQDEEPLKRR